MSHKMSAARREAFLRALARSGNQTLAAEQARVSQSWVGLTRRTDQEFAAAMARAVEEAKAALAAAPSSLPPRRGLRWQDGQELVVRGSHARRVQIARARVKQWSPRVERRFLRALSATCNVRAACAEVGMTAASAYVHRRRWPNFARAWARAVEIGYLQIEHALIEAAQHLLAPDEFPDPPPIRAMTAGQAIHLLHMHKYEVREVGGRPGRWKPPPVLDEAMRESILRKFELVAWRAELDEDAALADEDGR